MISRHAEIFIKKLVKGFPVVAVTGPRQAGKTTLVKQCFPSKPYVMLENPDILELALNDPRGFLQHYRSTGVILDEVQRAPQLFSYLQEIVDTDKKMGAFILTGSQQFALLSTVTQSLAGRVGLIELLPFAYEEIKSKISFSMSADEWIYKGGYPPLYDRDLDVRDWFSGYVLTYLERDIRSITKVHDLTLFQRFLRMCAARTGQILNLSGLASDCGITHNTARNWLSILEASYIVFLLQPYYVNLNKRLIKSPKLYFYDTGLVTWLLGIKSAEDIYIHSSRGALFENMVIAEGLKTYLNIGQRAPFYYYRDSNGVELDLIIEKGQHLHAIEIKAGATINTDYFKHLKNSEALLGSINSKTLVYAGETELETQGIKVVNWARQWISTPL